MASFNLGQALSSYKEGSELFLLEAGEYVLQCTSAKAGTAAKGPKITPVFKVYAGPFKGKRVMCGTLSFAEGALFRTIPQIKGFGISEEFMHQANSQPDPIQTLADAMVGRVIEAKVSVEEWQGEDRNRLGSVQLYDGPTAPSAPTTTSNQPSF